MQNLPLRVLGATRITRTKCSRRQSKRAQIVWCCVTLWVMSCPKKSTARVHNRLKLGVPVGIHTHNDLEMAIANALVAVRAGATQVQGTINGVGERTGNMNLISFVGLLQAKLGCPLRA